MRIKVYKAMELCKCLKIEMTHAMTTALSKKETHAMK